MPRFFVEEPVAPDQQLLQIQGEDARHIRLVLRMGIGDPLIVCDGAGTDLYTSILELSEHQVVLEIQSRTSNQTEPLWRGRLFQGLPKGDKMDQIIQKSVELGVCSITPVVCQRCVAKISSASLDRKLDRWNKIAREAAKQSGRGRIPKVHEPVSFHEAIQQLQTFDLAFVPWENEREQSLRNLLAGVGEAWISGRNQRSIGFLVGPEGGFSLPEVEAVKRTSLPLISLGARILRTETAAAAILAMLGYQFDQK